MGLRLRPMRRLGGILVVVGGLLAATPVCAYAQAAPAQSGRPYRGLFGSGGGIDQSLALTLSLVGGFDTSVQTSSIAVDNAGTPATASTVESVRTAFEQANASLNYTLSRGRASVTASGAVGATRYQTLDRIVTTYGAGVGAAFVLSSRTNLSVNEDVRYQPLFFSNLFQDLSGGGGFAGQPIIPDTTTGAHLDNFVSQNTDLGLTHRLSKRVDVSLGYDRNTSSFASDESIQTQTITGRLTFNVTQHLSVWGSDGYFESSTTTSGVESPTTRGHLVNFGLGYNRLSSISLSRHLKLSLGIGGAMLSDGHQEQLAVTGNATLNYEIGRSWTASGGYSRSVGFVQFFQQPVTSDTVFAKVGGLVARRLSFQAAAGLSRSNVAFIGPSNSFDTEYLSSSLSLALTRQLALGIGYSDSRYQFGSGVQVPNGILSHVNGQTVYVFLDVWQPIFGSRRGNASR